MSRGSPRCSACRRRRLPADRSRRATLLTRSDIALWQFDIEVIPAERVGGRPRIDPDEFGKSGWWSDRQPPADYRERLAALLPPAPSWSANLLLFGTNQGDRIDVLLERGRVESVRARVDCRTPADPPTVAGLLTVARDWSCALVESRYWAVLPDTAAGLARVVADSPSRRWMEDPAYWLTKLTAEVRASEGDGR